MVLGFPEDEVNPKASHRHHLWLQAQTRGLVPALVDPVPAAAEALSTALQEAGFEPA